jgi:hypothetical protein
MKFLTSILFIAFIVTIFSCKEVLPDRVVVDTIDSTYINSSSSVPQARVVLFEEFTGTSCINCPDGHEKLKDLTNLYGSKMAVMGLHFGDLSSPVETKDQDLRTSVAAEIGGFFGVSSMPSGTINRQEFGGLKVIGRLDWRTNLESILNNPVKVNVSQQAYTDPKSDNYVLELTIEVQEDITENMTFSIALTEDKIFVAQKNGSAVEENYEQKHVLRSMYTNSLGSSLKKATGKTYYEKGRVFKKILRLDKLNTKWNTNNMHIISFVSNESTKEVLQANTIKFK